MRVKRGIGEDADVFSLTPQNLGSCHCGAKIARQMAGRQLEENTIVLWKVCCRGHYLDEVVVPGKLGVGS